MARGIGSGSANRIKGAVAKAVRGGTKPKAKPTFVGKPKRGAKGRGK